MNTQQVPIVILGIGKDGKTRAGSFGSREGVPPTMLTAAIAMGNRVGRAETAEALGLLKHVPTGKTFASGKQLLPLIKRDVYDRLLKALIFFEPAAVGTKPATEAEKDTREATKLAPAAAAKTSPSAGGGDKIATVAAGKDAQPVTPPGARWTDPWSLVTTGSTVLYCADPKEGWWLCRVKDVSHDGRTLTLQWRDFKNLPVFQAKRIAVGLVGKIPS